MPVSSLTLEKPGDIMTYRHIWCEHLTASPPNHASSGRRSPGRPTILSSSCSPFFSRHAVVIPNSHITMNAGIFPNVTIISQVDVSILSVLLKTIILVVLLCICTQLHIWLNCPFQNSNYMRLGTLYI